MSHAVDHESRQRDGFSPYICPPDADAGLLEFRDGSLQKALPDFYWVLGLAPMNSVGRGEAKPC
jgi:hypothetical protein